MDQPKKKGPGRPPNVSMDQVFSEIMLNNALAVAEYAVYLSEQGNNLQQVLDRIRALYERPTLKKSA